MKFHKNRHLLGKDQTFQKLNGLAPNTISIDHVYFFLLTLFVNRYEEQGKFRRQVKAQNLWQAICQSQIETGTPYMLYKDACNRKSNQQVLEWVDPLHPNISMHILHTVLYTFPRMLTRRICLTIKNFFSLRSVPFAWFWCAIEGLCNEKNYMPVTFRDKKVPYLFILDSRRFALTKG